MLLDALHRAGTLERYVPVDVTEQMVRDCADELTLEYPGLRVHGVIGDFERHLDRVPAAAGPRLVVFLGGTIGNFPPGSRRRFLRDIAGLLGPDDHLLMGTDLVKDPDVLEAAYDDAQGVTAEFNRNLLHVLNRELDADFEPHDFDHVALFDDRHEWIEMRLPRGARTPSPCARWSSTCTSTPVRSCAPRSPPSSLPPDCAATSTLRASSSCAGSPTLRTSLR